MGYILASGCSYTDPNYKIQTPDTLENKDGEIIPWDTWPDIIAKRQNKDCVNLGKSGDSNKNIIDGLYDYILKAKEDPDEVYVMLSGWDRIQALEASIITSMHMQAEKFRLDMIKNPDPTEKDLNTLRKIQFEGSDINSPQRIYMLFAEYLLRYQITIDKLINNTLMPLYIFCEFCINRNIKVIFGQGTRPWIFDEFENSGEFRTMLRVHDDICNMSTVHHKLISNFYFNKLEDLIDDKVAANGWPFFKRLGGTFGDDIRCINDHAISEYDLHPDAVGQELFADYMMGKIK